MIKIKKNIMLFFIFVIMPISGSAYYFYKLATDQYVSEAQFIVQGSNSSTVDVLGALTGLPSVGSGSSDAMIIRSYLRSRDFLKDIQKVIDIRKQYSNPSIDFYARLKQDASEEDLLDYWQSMSDVIFDHTSGIGTIQMASFDRQSSKALVEKALEKSEVLINEMSRRLRSDALQQAEQDAKVAENSLAEIRSEITRFRQRQDILDPNKQTEGRIEQEESARLSMVSQLQSQLAQAESELAQVSRFMQPETLKVKNLQSRVDSLKQQLNKEKANTQKQTSGKSTQAAAQLAKYNELQSKLTFAEQLYQSKTTLLEQARLEEARQHRYLTVIVKPNLPDKATRPDKLEGVLTVALLSFLFWAIGSLSIAVVRDHAGWV